MFPPKVAGKILSLVSHPFVDTLHYMKLKSNFIFSEITHCTAMGIWHINYTLYKHFLGKCTEKLICC